MADKISITQPSRAEMEAKGVLNWPVWTCEVSEFPWSYSDQETCYILEGEIEVTTEEEVVQIKPGDFVVFPKGLSCTWKVSMPVRKHYHFG
ncbi:MAG TPA: cupin domain-containing protein [Candidatus Marinimicrobia bacterium]|jgi:hypothetical protein|nr:cupin domain-containing protein [Candidatus Neomarinimicrobiota bacterium]MDP7217632.1 cupin domain-containing protein [Candidatus Neomarinimicrobiota bacterium]MDP7436522.1 cupin domain-containing protein [Candidatus Neomarinimicrobiota bacterium]HBN45983.1 cupin [Candidatus Neomarinimicrobiota bacterium]HJL74130.1 cupin domain-containing protein [Candidatus Neomarinimicrobiota bacterium]|tara:strand:+ start:621 stop:893 length:273 start_codon:yes stop_codon:yes gene_type:complete